MTTMNLRRVRDEVERFNPRPLQGRVTGITGLTVSADGPAIQLGEICCLISPDGSRRLWAEVVGFHQQELLLMPLGDPAGLGPDWRVRGGIGHLPVRVGPELLGRVIDGLGQPLDSRGPITATEQYPLQAAPPNPLKRQRITAPLATGVRVIDALLTCGRGQRLGIFAGSGVGKSTLLGMLTRGTEADAVVVGLVGERGREVREFLERDLGPAGLARAAVVVATSDQPAVLRIRAALAATAIAEYLRDQGQNVLLLIDSVTRLAMAQRELGLAVGEPPTTRGYPPSVFSLLARFLERTGTAERGSITAFYTVLVDGDDMNEPVADAVRGILDGHVVLSRRLGAGGHFPAVEVLQSVSRLMSEVAASEHQRAAEAFRSHLAIYQEAEDLINIGAYQKGSNPAIDRAVALRESMLAFLRQRKDCETPLPEAVAALQGLFLPG